VSLDFIRKEALATHRMSWHGSISLTQPLPVRVLIATAVVAALPVELLLALIVAAGQKMTRILLRLTAIKLTKALQSFRWILFANECLTRCAKWR